MKGFLVHLYPRGKFSATIPTSKHQPPRSIAMTKISYFKEAAAVRLHIVYMSKSRSKSKLLTQIDEEPIKELSHFCHSV